MSGLVRRERRDGVAVLTLDRPDKRNALSTALLHELRDALTEAGADATVSVVVITGSDPAFCAGVDLQELGGGARPLASDGAVDALRALPQPSIAAVNGACVTGGLELALNCDLRIASDRARFADTHARVGVHPGWGLTALLPRLVGPAAAREMSFTGDYVDAVTALRLGLVNRVVPHERLLPEVMGLAGEIATTDRATLQAVKRLYDGDEALVAALERERRGFLDWRAHLDTAGIAGRVEGVVARGREQTRRGDTA